MYAADINSTRYTFNTSGSLWRDALVMMDMETKSYWSQIDGRAIKGDLKGTTLTLFPFVHTTFAEFKKQYPDGKLLKKPDKGSHGSASYGSYFADPSKIGIFGRQENLTRLGPKDMIYGLRWGDTQIAVSQRKLGIETFVIIDDVTPPIVVMTNGGGNTARAFAVGDALEKEKISVEDGTILVNGKASQSLEPLPVTSAFWFAWTGFFPETRLIK